MQNRFGLLILDVMPMFMIIALDIVIIICSSINCPTVICLPTVCYFLERKPLVKSTTPGSIFSSYIFRSILLFDFLFISTFYFHIYIAIWILFICIFYFQINITKNPKIPRWIYLPLFYLHLPNYIFTNLLPERDWQPLLHVGLQVFVLCVQVPFT